MLKRIKQIKKVGVYRDFSWSGSSCFKRYNAFYGFNGSGKSTLSRIFQSLDGSALSYRESGSAVTFDDYDGNVIDVREEQKHRDVLVYDEDFVANNLRWEQGIKSFVVIGKRSAYQEERFKELSEKKQVLVGEKKANDANTKKLEEEIGDHATSYARELRAELIKYQPDKYNRYDKRPFLADVDKAPRDGNFKFGRADIGILRLEIEKQELEKIGHFVDPLSRIPKDTLNSVIEFLKSDLPTSRDFSYVADEVAWLESGLHIHKDRQICLLCNGELSEQRKEFVKLNLTNEVSKFIKRGQAYLHAFKTAPALFVAGLTSKNFYQEFKSRFEDELIILNSLHDEFIELHTQFHDGLNKKISFEDINGNDLEVAFLNFATRCEEVAQRLQHLISENNLLTNNLSNVRSQALQNLTRVYIEEYRQKIAASAELLVELKEKHSAIEVELHELTKELLDIEASLQSEAKAVLGINNMIHVFLGRADIKIEYREQEKKFEVVRRGVPAKRLSEGEKTAIAVCYFLILVNANPERRSNLIVVIDDPISSLDSNNLYNAYAVIRQNLRDVKQLFVLTHNLYFYRLVWKWFNDFGAENAYFRISAVLSGNELNATIVQMNKLNRETSTEYILLWTYLKAFVATCAAGSVTSVDCLPYPNVLRRLVESYLSTKYPGKSISHFDEELIALGMNEQIALQIDRFCNDFSHARFDSLSGQEGNTIDAAVAVVKDAVTELERIDPAHFTSMNAFAAA